MWHQPGNHTVKCLPVVWFPSCTIILHMVCRLYDSYSPMLAGAMCLCIEPAQSAWVARESDGHHAGHQSHLGWDILKHSVEPCSSRQVSTKLNHMESEV